MRVLEGHEEGELVMAHYPRRRGESGFYHIVAKGDGGQIIFEDKSDRNDYLELLRKASDEMLVSVHGYCLMSNHVHLLVEDIKRNGSFSAFMKQVNEAYARHFQWKTGREGHVFEGRFWSEPVETDEYFMCALRYIHANPEAARICRLQDYPWSSYKAYLGEESFVETGLGLGFFPDIKAFADFSASGCQYATPFSGSKLRDHLNPDELATIAIELLGHEGLNAIAQQDRATRCQLVKKLARAGFTEKEIVRVTGLGRQAVRGALSS